MRTPIDITSATLSPKPFPHFCAPNAIHSDVANELLDWLEAAAPWQLVIADFYEQYEFSLADVAPPGEIAELRSRRFLQSLTQTVSKNFMADLDEEHVDITVHKLMPGQRIRIHNDFIPGRETHRLLVQLNRNWMEVNGGVLMLFSGPNGADLCQLIRPLHRSAFGFEISATSYHAVAPVVRGERYTLVYSFYRKRC